MRTEEIISLEERYLAQTYARPPFVLESGEGMVLRDTEGNEYLDFVSGLGASSLGHGDPEVRRALAEQPLIHVSNLYHSAPHAYLAQELCESCFADRVFFCNSGTEATEGALKFARLSTGRTEFVTFENGFHGRSMGALSVTYGDSRRVPFEPLIPGVHWAKFNDLKSVEQLMSDRIAAVIVEPIQGEGGVVPAEKDFLYGLRGLCDCYGARLIFDEVQCGLSRTGRVWAHQFSEVSPDLMTVAKPLAAGLPIGAVLMSQEVASHLSPGIHGSTFAGGPMVTSVARVVFRRLSSPSMLTQVARMEKLFCELLSPLAQRSCVEQVRGRGLMWGLQFNDSVQAKDLVEDCYRSGVLLAPAGQNTVRMLPPFIVEERHLKTAVKALMTALEQRAGVPA